LLTLLAPLRLRTAERFSQMNFAVVAVEALDEGVIDDDEELLAKAEADLNAILDRSSVFIPDYAAAGSAELNKAMMAWLRAEGDLFWPLRYRARKEPTISIGPERTLRERLDTLQVATADVNRLIHHIIYEGDLASSTPMGNRAPKRSDHEA